jgi:tRNA G18 (ribose-2'-O)-methylase SpoU
VLMTDRRKAKLAFRLPEDVPTYVVPHELISALVGFQFHRGILACAERRPWPALEEILPGRQRPLTLVICPKLSDPENLGAIARIGDVFGIDLVLAGPSCPDPFSRRVLRVSMGAVLRLPVIVIADLSAALDRLVEDEIVELIAAVADPGAEPLLRLARPQRVGLVLGEEDQGVPAEWLAKCRRKVTIPMRAGAGSLNVAVAAGILIHQLTREALSPGSDTHVRP